MRVRSWLLRLSTSPAVFTASSIADGSTLLIFMRLRAYRRVMVIAGSIAIRVMHTVAVVIAGRFGALSMHNIHDFHVRGIELTAPLLMMLSVSSGCAGMVAVCPMAVCPMLLIFHHNQLFEVICVCFQEAQHTLW